MSLRIRLPKEDADELIQGWKDREQIPAEYREQYETFIRNKYAKQMEEMDPPFEGGSSFDELLKFGLQALDYGSGVTRAGVMGGASALANGDGKQFVQDMKDAINPFDGKPAPGTKEYRQRNGLDGEWAKNALSDLPGGKNVFADPKSNHPWWQPEQGGALDVTAGGAVDFTGDAVVSPSALIGLSRAGLKAMEKSAGAVALRDRLAQSAPKFANVITSPEFAASRMTAREMKAAERLAERAARNKTTLGTIGDLAWQGFKDPLEGIIGGASNRLYKSAFKEADKAALDAGAPAVSKVMMDDGFFGTARGAAKRAEGIQDAITAEQELVKRQMSPSLVTRSRADVRQPVINKLRGYEGRAGMTAPAQRANQKIADEFIAAWNAPGGKKSMLNFGDLDEIAKDYQLRARAMGAYKKGLMQPSRAARAADNAVEGALLGEGYATTAQAARRGQEGILDDVFANPLRPTSSRGASGRWYQQNQKSKALLQAEDALGDSAQKGFREMAQDSIIGGVAAAPAVAYAATHQSPVLAAALGLGGLASTGTTVGKTTLGLAGARGKTAISNSLRGGLTEKFSTDARKDSPWTALGKELGLDLEQLQELREAASRAETKENRK